jgi:hypothetical protein
MTETSADHNTDTGPAPRFQSLPARRLAAGSIIKSPDGSAAEITAVQWEQDDYGNDVLALVQRKDGGTFRVSAAATVELAGAPRAPARPPRSGSTPAPVAPVLPGTGLPGSPAASESTEPPLPLIPAEEGTPEAVVANAAAAHGAHDAVQHLAAKLSRGLNLKSGANLRDVQSLAQVLFVELDDQDNSVAVSRLITGLPFDGNPGRWTPVAHCLALTHYIARINGDTAEAARLAGLLRVPEDAETDPLRAKLGAQLRQRSLNEPNLYDKEIERTSAAGERQPELDWRLLRLNTLLELLAHGGSETFDDQELLRRISNELTAVRAAS